MRKCLYKNSEELKLNCLKTEILHGEVAVFKNIPKIPAVPMKTKQKKQGGWRSSQGQWVGMISIMTNASYNESRPHTDTIIT